MTGKVVFCKVNQFTRADEVANAMDGYRQELGSEVKVKGHKLPAGRSHSTGARSAPRCGSVSPARQPSGGDWRG